MICVMCSDVCHSSSRICCSVQVALHFAVCITYIPTQLLLETVLHFVSFALIMSML